MNNRSAYPTSSDWDVAHLFSGKTLNPGNGNYCTYSSGAGIAILRNDPATFESYGCSISQQNYVGNNENEWLLGHCIGLSLNADHAYAGSSSDWMWPIWNTLSTLNMNSNDVNRIQTFAQQVCDRSKLINFGGSEHWINLYVTNMVMITTDVPTVGNSVTFGFTIYNTASTSIDLDVLVVGGRDAYGNVKDFGQRTNVHINASGGSPFEYWFTSSTGFESGGTWTIFASALENGQYSPYEWLALHPTVYYCLNSWHRTSTLPEFSSNDLFHQWGIYATSPYVGPGSEIMVSFTLFSKAGGTGYTNYNWIFVMVNDPNDAWKDFGGVSNVVLTNGGNNGILGGGLHEKVTTTLDGPSGVWKIGPSYQIAGQDWGPWMAPLYIDVGFIDIKYSDLIIPHTWDQDTTYVISTWVLAPTFGDPSVSFIKVGMAIAIHTFTSVTGRPSMEVAIATYYNDPYTPYGGSYNIYNNQPRDVSVYINKTTFNSGVYGTTYGNPYFDGVDPKTKSGVDILDGQQETYSYGYGMAYPTYTSPDPYIYAGDIAMVAIGALVSGLPGIAISAGWLCTSALVQLTSTQTDNPHDVGFTSGGSSAYAHWDRANLPFHDPYGYDRFYWTYENNVSTVNYAFLEIADDEGTTGWDNVSHGKFSFQFQCMYKYSFKGGVNGQQNDRFVTTSPLYICISP